MGTVVIPLQFTYGTLKQLCQDQRALCQEWETRTHYATQRSGFSCSSPREQEAMRSCLIIPKKTFDNFLASPIYYLKKKQTWRLFVMGALRRQPVSWEWVEVDRNRAPFSISETLPKQKLFNSPAYKELNCTWFTAGDAGPFLRPTLCFSRYRVFALKNGHSPTSSRPHTSCRSYPLIQARLKSLS